MAQTQKPPTLEVIAKAAGVSRSTVSRVVNDEPNVSDEVRTRVWQVIDEMGYQPNAAARSLASRRSQILGIVIPQAVNTVFVDPFYPMLLQGVSDGAAAHGYNLMLSMLSQPSEEEDFYRRALRSQILDGLVISSAMVDDPLVSRLLRDHIPFVTVGHHPDESLISYVDADNVHGAQTAVNYFIQAGRKRIATITGPLRTIPGIDRLEGYKRALRSAGMPVDEALIAEGDFTEESGYRAMHRLLDTRPDAVFIGSDLMAMGALRALRDANVSVPDDVAVIGFDDAQLASVAEPPLATVRQPVTELGTTAVDLLLELIEGDGEVGPLRAVLPTELIIRPSAGGR